MMNDCWSVLFSNLYFHCKSVNLHIDDIANIETTKDRRLEGIIC